MKNLKTRKPEAPARLPETSSSTLKRANRFRIHDTRDGLIVMTLMTVPFVLFKLLTHTVPLYGITLAFKDFNYIDGLVNSPWADPLWKNFKFLFTSAGIIPIILRTIFYSLLGMFTGLVFPVSLAIILNEVRSNRAAKTYQTILTWPSYLSAVVLAYVAYGFLNTRLGLLNQVIEAFGGEAINVYTKSSVWAVIIPIIGIWAGTGSASLLYYSTILNIDPTYYEAATLDGATRWQMIWKITLPQLLPVIAINLILSAGSVLSSNFGLFYNLPMGSAYVTKDLMVYDVYTYTALMEQGNVALSAAAGFLKSVVGCVLIIITNLFVKKISPENSLF